MAIMIGISLGLLIGGLIVMVLSKWAGPPTLQVIVWWIGLVLVIFGVILLVTPVFDYLYAQIRQMIVQ